MENEVKVSVNGIERSTIDVAKEYAEASAKAAAAGETCMVMGRMLADRCRSELGDRWVGINFNSARSSKAGDHASSLGMTLDQLKTAIEIKDIFDATITKSLKRKGFTEERAKSVKDQKWLDVRRITIRDLKREAEAKAGKAGKAKTAEPGEPEAEKADPLTVARQQCNNLVIALNALIDKTGKASLDLTDLEEAIAITAKVQKILNPK